MKLWRLVYQFRNEEVRRLIPANPTIHLNEIKANAGKNRIIVADDMTGACDAAAPFAQLGLRTLVLTNSLIPADLAWDVLAFSTETRNVTSNQASFLLEKHLSLLDTGRCPGRIFKKIDSVLRGNTFIEIAALKQMLSPKVLAVAPAFPALQRVTHEGVQVIGRGDAQQRIDMVAALLEVGIRSETVRCGLDPARLCESVVSLIGAGSRVLLFDANDQSDLDTLVQALTPLEDEICWVGSGGLAHALAASTKPGGSLSIKAKREGVMVFVIGSDHPVTQEQVKRLEMEHRVVRCAVGDGCPSSSIIVATLSRENSLKLTQSFFREMASSQVGCLFVTGGDTLRHLCQALDVIAIEIQREFAQGVPMGILRGGPLDGVCVITKSGGFGDCPLLSNIAEHFAESERSAL